MVSSRPQYSANVSVVVPTTAVGSRAANSNNPPLRERPSDRYTSNGTRTIAQSASTRIPYASKGKWKEDPHDNTDDTDEEYLGVRTQTDVDATLISTSNGHGSQRTEHLTFTQTKSRHSAVSRHTTKDAASSGRRVAPRTSTETVAVDQRSLMKSGISFEVSGAVKTIRHSTPPRQHLDYAPSQGLGDRCPPDPPPLPHQAQPWYLIYAPEVALAKLDTRENAGMRLDMDYISEGSQGRRSGSRLTPTSMSGLSRTPSKSRMRMVPPGQRERSRSRRATLGPRDDSDTSQSSDRGGTRSVQDEESEDSEVSHEVTSSSSESDSDREETDGTDSETEEVLEFKKATRPFQQIKYPEARSSSSTQLVVPCKKRKPLLEEMLPDTYGPKHASRISRAILDAVKPGTGPRAVARKTFARAIGGRLLAKKRQIARGQ